MQGGILTYISCSSLCFFLKQFVFFVFFLEGHDEHTEEQSVLGEDDIVATFLLELVDSTTTMYVCVCI